MSFRIRFLVTALVLLVVAGGAAQALPLPGVSYPGAEQAGFLDVAWEWVVSFFNPPAIQRRSSLGLGGPATGIGGGTRGQTGTKAGGMMDPDGNK